MELRDLPNTTGAIQFGFASSATAALRLLREGKAASDGAQNGAINLWRDDDGKLRGSRCVHFQEVELKTFRTQALAAKWYRAALKKIQ